MNGVICPIKRITSQSAYECLLNKCGECGPYWNSLVHSLVPNRQLSYLFHTFHWAEWRPVSAEEPAWSAAQTTSEIDSPTCTWSSFRWLLGTSSHEPPNQSKSCLGDRGFNTVIFPVFPGYCSKHQLLYSVLSLFSLAVWSYWYILCRQAEETHEPSGWWRRKVSFPEEKNTEWLQFRNSCILSRHKQTLCKYTNATVKNELLIV